MRLSIDLSAAEAERLTALARRAGVTETELAAVLIRELLDRYESGIDATALLEGIPGAHEPVRQGIEDIRAGRTISLGDL